MTEDIEDMIQYLADNLTRGGPEVSRARGDALTEVLDDLSQSRGELGRDDGRKYAATVVCQSRSVRALDRALYGADGDGPAYDPSSFLDLLFDLDASAVFTIARTLGSMHVLHHIADHAIVVREAECLVKACMTAFGLRLAGIGREHVRKRLSLT